MPRQTGFLWTLGEKRMIVAGAVEAIRTSRCSTILDAFHEGQLLLPAPSRRRYSSLHPAPWFPPLFYLALNESPLFRLVEELAGYLGKKPYKTAWESVLAEPFLRTLLLPADDPVRLPPQTVELAPGMIARRDAVIQVIPPEVSGQRKRGRPRKVSPAVAAKALQLAKPDINLLDVLREYNTGRAEPPPSPSAHVALRRLIRVRHNPDPAAQQAEDVIDPRKLRPKVLIVSILASQFERVRKCFEQDFNLHYINSQSGYGEIGPRGQTALRIYVMVDYAWHDAERQLRAAGLMERTLRVGGGPSALMRELDKLREELAAQRARAQPVPVLTMQSGATG